MKSMQRKFGKFTKRSDDNQDVGSVLAEFKAVDVMLDGLIKDLKAYRDAWEDILRYQYDCSEALANLYKPIDPPPPPEHFRQPTATPQKYMQKCLGLQKLYSDVRDDLAQELNMIDSKLIRPAEEAKACTKGLQKTLKHRENTKLDYERYLGRAEHARKKETRTPKEEIALATHEGNLQQAQIDYETADEQVREAFPPVTAAIISLLPQLLASQVMLQTTLVGQLYTVLDGYCKRNNLPSPAPSDDEIFRVWDSEFTGFRKELEQGISTLANGKVVHLGMALPAEKGSTVTGLGLRNRVMSRKTSGQGGSSLPSVPGMGSRKSSGAITSLSHNHRDEEMYEEEEAAPAKPPRPGQMNMGMPSPSLNLASKPRIPSSGGSGMHLSNSNPSAPYGQNPTAHQPSPPPPSYTPHDSTPPSRYQTPTNGIATPFTASAPDYFTVPLADQKRRASQASTTSHASSMSAIAAGKKKPPPPPIPAKRFPSGAQQQFVVALFDFEGQGGGDLAFREGDRIRVVKKTESTDDWWEGELKGQVGSFPANYVQV